jgi:hypothetical protein
MYACQRQSGTLIDEQGAWREYVKELIILCKVKHVKLYCYRHAGAMVERKYNSCLFLTSALDGDEWSTSRPGRALSPGNDLRYPFDGRLNGPQSLPGQ